MTNTVVNAKEIVEEVGSVVGKAVVSIGEIWRNSNGENMYDLERKDGSHVDGPWRGREEKILAEKLLIKKSIVKYGHCEPDMLFSKKNNDNELKNGEFEFIKEVKANTDLGKKLLSLHRPYKRNSFCNHNHEEYYYKVEIIAIDVTGERFRIYNIFTPCLDKEREYINKKYGYRD